MLLVMFQKFGFVWFVLGCWGVVVGFGVFLFVCNLFLASVWFAQINAQTCMKSRFMKLYLD